ncbi:spore gernimation protein [Cohnella sp. CIP 111063]|jgi:spore germination protein PB|uniref:spore germination protein GerPB n=1 Tax=unclassified Cohnella TaxID=2636738 RepID=UPI000B8BCFFC|nr:MULTISPECIES: spore germination protein GerPB [unclassified Cohnella]OXS52264.1 spore gernimation protein [Cohnella sp. CIP 111063]PRX55768.1 spore germination protein PB [Cohnella sp. SGD-V74]
MIWNVQQTITIGQLRIDGITNSSVLQIGSAGSIQSLSQLYNTGGFAEPAPELSEELNTLSLVPLPNPT